MDKSEIALQLALKAMDSKMISVSFMGTTASNESKEKANTFNAKQLTDFYNNVLHDLT